MGWMFNPCHPCCVEENCDDICLGGSPDDFETVRDDYQSTGGAFTRLTIPAEILHTNVSGNGLYLTKTESGSYFRDVILPANETSRRFSISAYTFPMPIDTEITEDRVSYSGVFVRGVGAVVAKYIYSPQTIIVLSTIAGLGFQTTWRCPDGVTSIQVECTGNGGLSTIGTGTHGGYGGGGGAYAKSINVAVIPGTTYFLQQNAVGFPNTIKFISVIAASAVGRLGGTDVNSVGTTKFSGGDGGLSEIGKLGGGGGGSAADKYGLGGRGGDGKAVYGGDSGVSTSTLINGGRGGKFNDNDYINLDVDGTTLKYKFGCGSGGPRAGYTLPPFGTNPFRGIVGKVVITYDKPSVRFGGIYYQEPVGNEFGPQIVSPLLDGIERSNSNDTLNNNRESDLYPIKLSIGVEYSGIDESPNKFVRYLTLDDYRDVYRPVIQTTDLSTARIGLIGENGGAWDNLCIFSNNHADRCFPCGPCQRRKTFPLRYLLSVPSIDNGYCKNCNILSGDFILENVGGFNSSQYGWFTAEQCCWVTIPFSRNVGYGNACNDELRNTFLDGFCWIFGLTGPSKATATLFATSVQMGGFSGFGFPVHYSSSSFDCGSVITLQKQNVTILGQPSTVHPCDSLPQTLTLTPIFE